MAPCCSAQDPCESSDAAQLLCEGLGSFHRGRWRAAAFSEEQRQRQSSGPSPLARLLARSVPPPGRTLVLGESNDNYIVRELCDACEANLTHWVTVGGANSLMKAAATFPGCNCSGWVLAFASHYGVSRSPPYHYDVDKPLLPWGRFPYNVNPFYVKKVPVDFVARLPFLADRFQRYWGGAPTTIVLHSGSWDSSRVCKLGNYSVQRFEREWRHNASEFIKAVESAFPGSTLLWRTGNQLARATWQQCPQMWRYHNAVMYQPLEVMRERGHSLLRWDRFVDGAASDANSTVAMMHQIHPPRAFHRAWAIDVLLPLLSERGSCRTSGCGARGEQATVATADGSVKAKERTQNHQTRREPLV